MHRRIIATFALASLILVTRANAYVDLAPTLGKIVTDSQKIAIIEVTQVNPENNTLLVKETRILKGGIDPNPQSVQHIIAPTNSAAIPRHILQWARPGAHAVLFINGNNSLV